MLFVAGLCLIAFAFAMVLIARPSDGVAAPFLKNWAIGQIYALGALTSIVVGVTMALSDLPF
jgi:hypothetical protein